MKTALILAFCVAAALSGSHEEFTPEQKAELDAKIATLTPEAQEAAKKIKGFFEANEGNKEAAMEQTKTFMATLPEGVVTEIKSIMPKHEHGASGAAAAPSRARRQAPAEATTAESAVEGQQE